MNTFGQTLRLTTFGESHGKAIGGILDGMPPRIQIDIRHVAELMAARRPGYDSRVSRRREDDTVEFLSGLTEGGVTLGTPIGFTIRNLDAHSEDYEELRHKFRPNHGDYTWQAKYGIRDWRGGGRASARETAARVAAAGIADHLLMAKGISVNAELESVGGMRQEFWDTLLKELRRDGESMGGVVSCTIGGVPVGLGEPVFGKLQAQLAYAMMTIPGVKGFEYGMGFSSAYKCGMDCVDTFTCSEDGEVTTLTNNSGGIQGGISNGMPINMRVVFKPTPTLGQTVKTIDDTGAATTLKVKGRHDPCIAVRGTAVVRAMAILTIADALLTAGHKF